MSEQQSGRRKQASPKDNWCKSECKILTEPFPDLKSALEMEGILSMHSTIESAEESAAERLERRKNPIKNADYTREKIINVNDIFDEIANDILSNLICFLN